MTANDSTTFLSNKLKVFFQSKRAKLDAHLASHLVEFIGGTKKSLDCAIYDLRYPDVLSALHRVLRAGKKLRIAYHAGEVRTAQALKDFKLVTYKGKPVSFPIHLTGNHLMHHKFLVRDGNAVWTGSANFTQGGLELQDNNCLIAESTHFAKQYAVAFQNLISPRSFITVLSPSESVNIDGVKLTPSFAPGAKEGIEEEIVRVLNGAQSIRMMAFLVSDPGILDALTAFNKSGFDIRGVYDPNGMKDALGKKQPDPVRYWFLNDSRFVKANSHPYSKTHENDFMHNKVLVIDDRLVITGSYNFSENAEASDENLVLIESPKVAAAYTGYFDTLFAIYSKA